MKRYDNLLEIIKENGYDGTSNISDFYFQHRKELDLQLYGPNVASPEFALLVRWKSVIGIECNKAIIAHILKRIDDHGKKTTDALFKNHKVMMNDPHWAKKVPEVHRDIFATIDLNDFDFQFDGKTWTLEEFVYSFPMEQRSFGPKDLIGIDFSGIKLRNCRLVSISLARANFDGAYLEQVELVNSAFPNASFRNARLSSVRLLQGTFLNDCDMTDCRIHGLYPLENHTLTRPFIYNEITYPSLLWKCFRSVVGRQSNISERWKNENHTVFECVRATDLTLRETRRIRDYIEWYVSIMERIEVLPRAPLRKRVGLMLSIVATKHWRSYGVFALFALVLDAMYAGVYGIWHAEFEGMPRDFLSILYSSTLIFTSMGVEGIKPIGFIGQMFLVAEVLTGYLVLGLFVYLLTTKVDKGY